MADISLFIGIGRLTRDAEVKTTPSGKSITQFTVASNPSWNKDDPALFMDCQMWGDRGVKLSEYLRRGVKVCVLGTLKQENWTGQDGQKKSRMRLDANDVSLLESRKDEGLSTTQDSQAWPSGIAQPTVSQVAAVFGVPPGLVQGVAGMARTKAPANDAFEDDIPF